MNNINQHITIFNVLLFLMSIIFFFKTKNKTQILYSKKFVDSLNSEIDLRDSLILDLNNHIPIGSPVDKIDISSGFGYRIHPISKIKKFHNGIDFSGTYRDTIYCTAEGIVTEATWLGGYGKCVKIKHKNGFETIYAHLSKIFVVKGDKVNDNTPIGKMGSTGHSTGCHLHYEILFNGKSINPKKYVYNKN